MRALFSALIESHHAPALTWAPTPLSVGGGGGGGSGGDGGQDDSGGGGGGGGGGDGGALSAFCARITRRNEDACREARAQMLRLLQGGDAAAKGGDGGTGGDAGATTAAGEEEKAAKRQRQRQKLESAAEAGAAEAGAAAGGASGGAEAAGVEAAGAEAGGAAAQAAAPQHWSRELSALCGVVLLPPPPGAEAHAVGVSLVRGLCSPTVSVRKLSRATLCMLLAKPRPADRVLVPAAPPADLWEPQPDGDGEWAGGPLHDAMGAGWACGLQFATPHRGGRGSPAVAQTVAAAAPETPEVPSPSPSPSPST